MAEGGSGRGGEHGQEVGGFPELSKVLNISGRILSGLALSLETVCKLQPGCSLCGIYLHILCPLSPDCCSRLTAKIIIKVNQEIFECKIRKEWWQMGTLEIVKNIAY